MDELSSVWTEDVLPESFILVNTSDWQGKVRINISTNRTCVVHLCRNVFEVKEMYLILHAFGEQKQADRHKESRKFKSRCCLS